MPVLNGTRTRRLKVCLLSPHPGLLASVQRLLASSNFQISALRLKFGPGFDLTQVRLPRASIYVVDGSSPRPQVESLIESIRERVPGARLLIVKETLLDERVFPYLRAGVKGVVRYVDARRELARAVKALGSGGFWLSRAQLARFVDSMLNNSRPPASLGEPGHLSRREREVLVSILQGLSNKEIAAKLNISERTVKFHVSHLLAKFGAQRRADLILKHYQVWPIAS